MLDQNEVMHIQKMKSKPNQHSNLRTAHICAHTVHKCSTQNNRAALFSVLASRQTSCTSDTVYWRRGVY